MHISYCGAADPDDLENEAPEVPSEVLAAAAANKGNQAWDMFGGGIDAAAAAAAANDANEGNEARPDVASPAYWEAILGGDLRCDGGTSTSAPIAVVDLVGRCRFN